MTSTTYKQRLILHLLSKTNRIKATQGQGFTLIELLVVIVILGVLGAVGYGAYINQLQRANINSSRVAAVAAAKSCVAINTLGDAASNWNAGVNTTVITLTPNACAPDATGFRASAGAGAQVGTGGADINPQGAVIPLE